MGHQYSHLSLDERVEIYRLVCSGASLRSIANAIGRHVSTVSREIRRNAKPTKQFAGGYVPTRANHLAQRRRRWDARFKMHRQPELRAYVRRHLAMGQSPEQIAGRLAATNAHMRISYESIYRYIYHRVAQKDWWHRLLPKAKSRRGRIQRGGLSSTRTFKCRRAIAERPKAADDRLQPGHWEADLMAFSKYGQYILVMHERSTRWLAITCLKSKNAAHVADRIKRRLAPLPAKLKRTITFDNGTEFAEHFKLHDTLGVETFFCDPHAPWQKGGVENAILRMRRMLPRKSDLARMSTQQIAAYARAYNRTPRKCLDFETPAERFSALLARHPLGATVARAPNTVSDGGAEGLAQPRGVTDAWS